MRYSIQSALLTRSTTSQKELNLCMLLGLVPSQLQRFVAKMSATFFLRIFTYNYIIKLDNYILTRYFYTFFTELVVFLY